MSLENGKIRFSHLESVVAVADHESFSAAADTVGLTQSAVSRSVATLESLLQVRLFVRAKSGVKPTPAGHRVLAKARIILDLVSALPDVAADSTRPRTIRIGAAASMASGLLSGYLERLREESSAVSPVVMEGDDHELLGWLRSGVIDLAITSDHPLGFEGVTLISEDPFLAVLPFDHPLTSVETIQSGDIAAHPFVLSRGSCGPPIRRYMSQQVAGWEPQHEATEISTILSLVRSGLGISILPETALRGAATHDLVTRSLKPATSRSIHLLQGYETTPFVESVFELISHLGE